MEIPPVFKYATALGKQWNVSVPETRRAGTNQPCGSKFRHGEAQ